MAIKLKAPILSVYDKDGNEIPIPAIKGRKGDRGKGIKNVTGNPDGTWTFYYEDGTSEIVNSEIVNLTAKAKEHADASADSAKKAGDSETNAKTSEDNAKTSESNSLKYSNNSKAEADRAKQITDDAKQEVINAGNRQVQDAKEEADRSKKEADRSAEQVTLAVGQVNLAKGQVSLAKKQVELAEGHANTAKQEADRAKDEADRAVAMIDDSIVETQKTWSSEKISQEIQSIQETMPVYGVKWDQVEAKMTRTGASSDFPVDTTSFAYHGSTEDIIENPFDNIYPWSGRKLCNISIEKYMALKEGEDIRKAIVAWEDDPTFSYDHVDGVWVYTPDFWGRCREDNGSVIYELSAGKKNGFIYYPKTIEGRWHGGIYDRVIDGVSKKVFLPKPGVPGINTSVRTFHAYAKEYKGTLDDIHSIDKNNLMYVIEFANMNTQNAIGTGVSYLYYQNNSTVQEDGAEVDFIKIKRSEAKNVAPDCLIEIGNRNGSHEIGSFVVSAVEDDPTNPELSIVQLKTDGATPVSINVSTTNFWSIHGSGCTKDEAIGSKSGYTGSPNKCHAYYRGEVFHANMYFYVLGVYREKDTAHIWISKDEKESDKYDDLDKSVHTDTGFVLPENVGTWIGGLHIPDSSLGLSLPPFTSKTGGSSSNPVGDYIYTPANTASDTILLLSGNASYASRAGRFYGGWWSSSWSSRWDYSARPRLLNP